MNYHLWMTRAAARLVFVIGLALGPSSLSVSASANTQDPRPIRIRLDADMTMLQAGEAIRRGIVLAIDEIKAAGGALDLTFLQTFSFADPPIPDRSEAVYQAYCTRFADCSGPSFVPAPVGTAQAYDLLHLLHMAIERAGRTDRDKVRVALENLGPFRGLLRNYELAFTPKRHDALDVSDFRLFRFSEGGAIVPMALP